jgi:hypothetical protein
MNYLFHYIFGYFIQIKLLECCLLFDKNKLIVQVFGMFTVDPSNILAVSLI